MSVEIDLLGRFAVRRDGQPVPDADFGGRQARHLIRMLAVRQDQAMPHDHLTEALWGERPPADPAGALHVLVNRARRALGDPQCLRTVPGGYLLSGCEVDTDRFAALVREPGGLTGIRQALAMWRGEVLPEDLYADWAGEVRDRLERLHQQALETGAEIALEAGDVRAALEWATDAARREPLREAACLLQVRALAAGGDVAAALGAWDSFRRRLADELGIDPSPAATSLHRDLLRGAQPDRPTPGARMPFVGREADLSQLATLATGRSVLVVAPAGYGKSRLLAEYVARSGRRAVQARAAEPEREAPWSLARALLRSAIEAGADPAALSPLHRVALGDLLPELAPPESGVRLEERSRRALALDAAARLVSSVRPALLVADDLQWADASSLDFLVVLGRNTATTMLVAARPTTDGRLARLRDGLDPQMVRLLPLSTTALRELVEPDVADAISDSSDGTPYAVLDVLAVLESQGLLARTGDRWRSLRPSAPAAARAAATAGRRRWIGMARDRQAADGRRLLDLMAVLGRPASTGFLARTTGLADPDALLSDLGETGLVRLEAAGWSLAHDLIAETLVEALTDAERARLHLMLSRALAGEPRRSAERARHLAGAGDAPAAAEAFAEAARDRLAQYADQEAELLAEAGLVHAAATPVRQSLLEVRAEARMRRGDRTAARDDLREVLSGSHEPRVRARILTQLARLASGAEDMIRAEHLADLALAEAGHDPESRARALVIAAIIDMNLGRPQIAEERYEEALLLFRRVGDTAGIADIIDARAMAVFMSGNVTDGVAAFGVAAGMFEDIGNLLRTVTPRSTRSHGLAMAGRHQEAEPESTQALGLARSLGNLDAQAFALWQRAEVLAYAGRWEEALGCSDESSALAEQIGHRGWATAALRARGVALHSAGQLSGAEAVLRQAVASSERISLFAPWARARLALVLLERGEADEAADVARLALDDGPGLVHHEARWALAAACCARGTGDAEQRVEEALVRAQDDGYLLLVPPLLALRDQL